MERTLAEPSDEVLPWDYELAEGTAGGGETAISQAQQIHVQTRARRLDVQLPGRDVAALKHLMHHGLDDGIVVRRTAVKAVLEWISSRRCRRSSGWKTLRP